MTWPGQPPVARQHGLDESVAALATLQRLALLRDQARHRALTDSEQAELDEHESPCVHCGGFHVRACPRVRRVVFRQGGQGVQEVEYWPAREIDWTGVIFEDVGGDEEASLLDEEARTDLDIVVDFILQASRRDVIQGGVVDSARRLSALLDEAEPSTVRSVHGPED